MWRSIASNALSIILVGLVILAGVISWAQNQYSSAGPLENAVCLRVAQGSNFSKVSNDLEAQGALSSPSIFRLGVRYSDRSSQLKAGAFLVPAGASMHEIVDIVTRGGASNCGREVIYRIGVASAQMQLRELDPNDNGYDVVAEYTPSAEAFEIPQLFDAALEDENTRYRILIAEGATVWRVSESLKHARFLSGSLEANEIPAEGRIAPDSYEVRIGTNVDDVIAQMVEAQDRRLAKVWEGREEGLPLQSAEELLILASIIEKETGLAEERPQVASVFVNRLRQGMKLQTDPTVVYGVTDGKGVLGRGLRRSELRARNPYNTYVIAGMPPGPIANPGLAALEAAAHPDVTPYIFFVADGTGGHAFSRTLAEHNRNVARWREIERQRAN